MGLSWEVGREYEGGGRRDVSGEECVHVVCG